MDNRLAVITVDLLAVEATVDLPQATVVVVAADGPSLLGLKLEEEEVAVVGPSLRVEWVDLRRVAVAADGVRLLEWVDLRRVVAADGAHLLVEWAGNLDMASNNRCTRREFLADRPTTKAAVEQQIHWPLSRLFSASSVCPCIFAVISAGPWALGPSCAASLR